MTKLQKLLTLLSGVLLVTVLGCSAWMDGITPAFIDPNAIEYSAEEPRIFMPYTSLWDARRIDRGLDYQHKLTQVSWARKLEDDNLKYGYIKRAMQSHIASAEELRNTLFSPTGPLSILFAAVPGLALGGYLIQRPVDKKRINELENGKNA